MAKTLPVATGDEPIPVYEKAIIGRMAYEGVPIRAIARVVKHPSDEVRAVVNDALANGAIIEFPPEDWPTGEPRNAHTSAVAFKKMYEEDLVMLCKRFFNIPPLQAAMLAVLIRRDQVSRETLHNVVEQRRKTNKEDTDPKIVDVIICNMRKNLAKHDLTIRTIWSYGYCMEPDMRRKANALLEEFLASLVVTVPIKRVET